MHLFRKFTLNCVFSDSSCDKKKKKKVADFATQFNISPGKWTAIWPVANVPTERWEDIDRNDCHTAWGNFKTLICLLQK
jgi:hypothetical protein